MASSVLNMRRGALPCQARSWEAGGWEEKRNKTPCLFWVPASSSWLSSTTSVQARTALTRTRDKAPTLSPQLSFLPSPSIL